MNQSSPAHKSGFTIGATCPGCAGEVELEHDFFVLTCRHCGSVLRIVMPEAPPAFAVRPRKSQQEVRFLLERQCRVQGQPAPNGTSPMQLLYYPYWKVDAVTLKVRSTQYEADCSSEDNPDDTHTDERELTIINLTPFMTTYPAGPPYDGIPASLGMRAEYVQLRPFTDGLIEPDATCLPVSRPAAAAFIHAEKAVASIGRIEQSGSLRNETRLFHPQGSIIYFPYYLIDSYRAGSCVRYIVDGLTGRLAGTDTLENTSDPSEPGEAVRFGALQLALHRCSNCGADLPATRSVVYQCHNCQHVEFFESHDKLERQLYTARSRDAAPSELFPFWLLSPEHGSSPERFFGGIRNSEQLVIPAFGLRNFESIYRLAKRMTTAASQLDVSPMGEIEGSLAAACCSLAEAMTLLEVLWYREMAARDSHPTTGYRPPRIGNVKLVFVPFHSEQYFYIDSILNAVTFEKAGTFTPSRAR